jgi:membrane protein implicated in regulation of membrane protease activity
MEGGKLLLVFLITLLIGQLISVSVGLLVERLASPYTGLVTFLACYFAMLWVAWRVAVRITAPHSRLGGSAPGQQEKASTARRADLSEAPSARR